MAGAQRLGMTPSQHTFGLLIYVNLQKKAEDFMAQMVELAAQVLGELTPTPSLQTLR